MSVIEGLSYGIAAGMPLMVCAFVVWLSTGISELVGNDNQIKNTAKFIAMLSAAGTEINNYKLAGKHEKFSDNFESTKHDALIELLKAGV